METRIILDLCGGTGAWSEPYRQNGYDVRVITLPDYDVRTYKSPKGVYGILAAPPCTMFSIARNDKRSKEPRDFWKGLDLVLACWLIIWKCRSETVLRSETSLKFWALENPTGYLRDFLGQPAMTFHPYEFGDPYKKETDLWGVFNKPQKGLRFDFGFKFREGDFVKNIEHFADLKEHQIPIGYKEKTKLKTREILRSITPSGFAAAFYEANQ